MAKIHLSFDVAIPRQSHEEDFDQDRIAGEVKEKALKEALKELKGDQFVIAVPGGGPGMPETALDEEKTLGEQGVADGARLVIKPRA